MRQGEFVEGSRVMFRSVASHANWQLGAFQVLVSFTAASRRSCILALKEKAIDMESVAGPAAPSLGSALPAAIALPVLALAVYLTLYMSDVWRLGQIQLAPRVFYPGPIP
jgi:hypothetical protein